MHFSFRSWRRAPIFAGNACSLLHEQSSSRSSFKSPSSGAMWASLLYASDSAVISKPTVQTTSSTCCQARWLSSSRPSSSGVGMSSSNSSMVYVVVVTVVVAWGGSPPLLGLWVWQPRGRFASLRPLWFGDGAELVKPGGRPHGHSVRLSVVRCCVGSWLAQ